MRSRAAVSSVLFVFVALLTSLAQPPGTLAAPSPPQAKPAAGTSADVCPGPTPPGTARCLSKVRTDPAARAQVPVPAGQAPNLLGNGGAYGPAFLQSAYNLTTAAATAGHGRTVAIVDAYDSPNAESDLTAYRLLWGLPACTTANGCFKKVNQLGQQSNYPPFNSGWALEISLDVDMVSAICPNCSILLVEANTNSYADLAAAVDYAAGVPGVMAISNSYGGSETAFSVSYNSHYNHPGKVVTVSSGDDGYGLQFPSSSQYVTAVGGTSLLQATNTGTRNATETVWDGAGSGCSNYLAKPSWQQDGGCAKRTVADVSAVADPNTGVWVVYNGQSYIVGGTSASAPIIAATYALAGLPGAGDMPAAYPYARPDALNDITSGSNGLCGNYLCNGATGYDGPTGLGTPNGTAAFKISGPALSVSPASVAAGGSVTATWSGITNATAGDWIGLYKSGAPDSQLVEWEYVSCSRTRGSARAAGSCAFPIPGSATGGNYELRLFRNDTFTRIVASDTFAVVAPTLGVSPTSAMAGNSVTATWANISNPSAGDWLGLYKVGAADGALIEWEYVSCSRTRGGAHAAGSCAFALPLGLAGGNYELRLFRDDTFTRVVVSNAFSVTAATPTLSASPSSAFAGDSVTAAWAKVANPTPGDWIGLFQQGTADTAYLAWDYETCTKTRGSAQSNGSCAFPLPLSLPGGNYELRLFRNDGFTRVAVSNAIAVTARPPSLTVSPTSAAAGGSVTATWKNVSDPTPGDWIGLFQQGAADTAYLAWDYETCTKTRGSAQSNGSCAFPLPGTLAPGTYQLRLFRNDGFQRVVVSNTFTVTAGQPSVPARSVDEIPGPGQPGHPAPAATPTEEAPGPGRPGHPTPAAKPTGDGPGPVRPALPSSA